MRVCIKVNKNNVVVSYGDIINNIKPFEDGIEIDTDLDLDNTDIVNNYKLINDKLVELTEEEKDKLFSDKKEPTEVEILKQQLLETQLFLAELQYKNLLNNTKIEGMI